MSLQYTCPLPTAIGDLSAITCAEHFGQIVKIAFQRVGNPFTDIGDETEWTTVLAAADDTHVAITPFCENVIIPAGEPITEGGDDNTTLFGQAIIVGQGQVQVTGRFRGMPAANYVELAALISEAGSYNQIGVYLINEFGQVISRGSGTAGEVFPIQSFFIGSVGSEGFNTHNFHNFAWNFPGTWSDEVLITDLSWDIFSK
jgi:hypothetical protein